MFGGADHLPEEADLGYEQLGLGDQLRAEDSEGNVNTVHSHGGCFKQKLNVNAWLLGCECIGGDAREQPGAAFRLRHR